MKFDINNILEKLSNNNYPLFVSERNLQTAFVIEAYKQYPDYIYYPEYVYKENGETYHIDLLVCDKAGESIAFEFKYVVAGGIINVPGDTNYELRNHSAIDIRRYQCVRDVSRLEKYVSSPQLKCKKGYFIMITNMSGFWKGSKKENLDFQFDISHGSVVKHGEHKVNKESKFAKNHKSIEIKKDYPIKYEVYKEIHDKNNEKTKLFKSLCIEVTK